MPAEVFHSRSVDEIEMFLNEVYTTMRIGNLGGQTRARISHRPLSNEVAFSEARYSFDLEWAGPPPDWLAICDVVQGTTQVEYEGRTDTFGPGDQFLIARPNLAVGGTTRSSTQRATLIDPTVLTRVASGHDNPAKNPVVLLDHRPISRQAHLRVQRAIDFVRDSVLGDDDCLSPLIASTASQYLAATVLEAYPNTAVTEATAADRHDAHPETVRRAIEFITAHPDRNITVADIAAAAFVSPRAIQLAFRRHLNTTPTAYLRRVRLDLAHADLQAATGHDTTVTAVAARWGFASPTRFASHYRNVYGHTPGHALRN